MDINKRSAAFSNFISATRLGRPGSARPWIILTDVLLAFVSRLVLALIPSNELLGVEEGRDELLFRHISITMRKWRRAKRSLVRATFIKHQNRCREYSLRNISDWLAGSNGLARWQFLARRNFCFAESNTACINILATFSNRLLPVFLIHRSPPSQPSRPSLCLANLSLRQTFLSISPLSLLKILFRWNVKVWKIEKHFEIR